MDFSLATYGLGAAAGLLSTLSPCVLPLLPILIGSAVATHPRAPWALSIAYRALIPLAAIEPNEPLLASKITGPGQRANLAALIHEDMKAVTVRVDDVVGVAGFVLPGDMVDVILTRAPEKADATSDVILQDIRVLAVDQLTDAQTSKPSIARAVTLEVATQQAQRLAVAQQVGTLTLALRAAGQRSAEAPLRVTASQLSATPAPAAPEAAAPQRSTQTTIGVTRRSERHEYTVPRDGGSLAQ
jgi:pilus assembly protein CpaB